MSISVVIGTYGDLDEWAPFVRRAAASVKGQAPRDLVWMHAQSLAEARNKGAMAATGEWLLFLDADDTLAPGYLAHMREYRGDASLLKPSVQYFNEDGRPRGEPHLIEPVDLTDRKSTRLNSSHVRISYAVFCLKKKKKTIKTRHYG